MHRALRATDSDVPAVIIHNIVLFSTDASTPTINARADSDENTETFRKLTYRQAQNEELVGHSVRSVRFFLRFG